MSNPSATDPNQTPDPERHLVRRRRRRRHSFRMETEEDARRRDDYRALRVILPAILFLSGLLIWKFSSAEPDPQVRPLRLLKLGYWFMVVGGVLLLVALIGLCVRKAREALSQEDDEDDADEHRHHHHHHSHHSHSYED